MNNFLNEKFYFTHSENKIISEFFWELENIKKIGIDDFLSNSSINFSENKKENAKKLLNYIQNYKYPLYSIAKKKMNENLKSLKSNKITFDYPDNFETNEINISFKIKTKAEFEKILNSLNENKEKILDSLEILKRGG